MIRGQLHRKHVVDSMSAWREHARNPISQSPDDIHCTSGLVQSLCGLVVGDAGGRRGVRGVAVHGWWCRVV